MNEKNQAVAPATGVEGPVLRSEPPTLAEAAQLRLLDVAKLRFFRHGATLRLTIEADRSFPRIHALRAFPLSKPDAYVSIRDGANQEVGIIPDPRKLEPESRALVWDELERHYLLTPIRRIEAVKERFGTVEWHVETPRGRTRLTTRDLRENVLRPSSGRYIITDVEGNRFDITDFNRLDSLSQALLLRHV